MFLRSFLLQQAAAEAAQSEGLQIPVAAAGVLARKKHCSAMTFVSIPFYKRSVRQMSVKKKKKQGVALLFFLAESEGFEPPVAVTLRRFSKPLP